MSKLQYLTENVSLWQRKAHGSLTLVGKTFDKHDVKQNSSKYQQQKAPMFQR